MPNELISLSVTPGFGIGGLFAWTLRPNVLAPKPWRFVVEKSNTSDAGPWVAISPELSEVYVWQDTKRDITSRHTPVYFRVRLEGTDITSTVESGYGALSREKFCFVREILRQEKLIARLHAGVRGKIYVRNTNAANCTHCTDLILGSAILGEDCPVCGGTKFDPPFCGPFETWLSFSNTTRKDVDAPNGVGRINPATYSVRVTGTVQLRTDDLLKDIKAGKLYVVESVNVEAEVFRVPVIQRAIVNELPLSSSMYTLGALN